MTADMGASEQERADEQFVSRHLRRNFLVLASDFGTFSLGMTFASVSTILPAFAEHLGASNLVIGAIPSITTLGHALPPLFTANYTERLSRKLPFILFWTVFERLPLLALAVLVNILALSQPGLMLAMIIVMIGSIAVVGGALTPAWMDLIGKVVPTTYRGRFFAYGNTLSSGLGLGGAVLSGYFLQSFPYPLSYSLCFFVGFGWLIISYAFLASTLEPALASPKAPVGMATYFRRLPAVLAGDPNFAWFLIHRGIWVFASMANGFYTVFALRNLGAEEWEVASFTFVLLAAQTAAGIAFGFIADRRGHKPVLVLGTLGMLLGNAAALAAGNVAVVYLVFAGMAAGTAAVNVSANNFALEFARREDRPTYIGLANTLIAPLMFVGPLIGGILADQAGYRVVFALAGVFSALSAGVLWVRVRDPRAAGRGGEA